MHRLGRPRLHQHGDRCRAGHDQPPPRAAAGLRHLRDPPLLPGAAGAGGAVRRGRHRQRHLPAGLALLRPGRAAPSSCRPRCSPRCGSSPTRWRPAPSPSPCRRTCRPRPTTGPSSCSPSGPGTWPGHRPSGRGWRPPPPCSAAPGAPWSWPAAGCTTPAPSRRCWPSARRPASRSARRQAGKGSLPHGHPQQMGAVGSTGTTAANALARDADVVHRASAPGGATSPRPPAPPSRARTGSSASSTSTSPASTPASTPGCRSWPTPARRWRPWPRPSTGTTSTRTTARSRPGLWAGWDAQVEAAYHPPPEVTDRLAPRAAHPGRGAGRGQRAQRPPRRRAVRGRLDARRPAQAVAGARPQGLPRGVRLLLHGLRGAGLARHPAGRRDPRRVRHGRRRRLPDDADRAGHRGAGAHQGDRRARAEPWLPLHRLALGGAGLAALRHPLPLPRHHLGPARRRPAARRPRRQRPQPRGARHRGALARRAGEGHPGRQGGHGRRRPGRHPRQHRPAGARPRQPGVVGRPGQPGLRPGVHPRGLHPLPRPPGRSASPARRPPKETDEARPGPVHVPRGAPAGAAGAGRRAGVRVDRAVAAGATSRRSSPTPGSTTRPCAGSATPCPRPASGSPRCCRCTGGAVRTRTSGRRRCATGSAPSPSPPSSGSTP